LKYPTRKSLTGYVGSIVLGAALSLLGTYLYNQHEATKAYLTMLQVTSISVQVEYRHIQQIRETFSTGMQPVFEVLEGPRTDTLVRSYPFHTKASKLGKEALLELNYQIAYSQIYLNTLEELPPAGFIEALDIYQSYLEDASTVIHLETLLLNGKISDSNYKMSINNCNNLRLDILGRLEPRYNIRLRLKGAR